MKAYINKSALVAEIERKIRTEQGYSSGDAECGYRDCARDILSFLDTLEVKEINSTDAFIKKVEDYLNSQLYDWVNVTNLDQRSCANIIPKKDFIEDFKNYMKGE